MSGRRTAESGLESVDHLTFIAHKQSVPPFQFQQPQSHFNPPEISTCRQSRTTLDESGPWMHNPPVDFPFRKEPHVKLGQANVRVPFTCRALTPRCLASGWLASTWQTRDRRDTVRFHRPLATGQNSRCQETTMSSRKTTIDGTGMYPVYFRKIVGMYRVEFGQAKLR